MPEDNNIQETTQRRNLTSNELIQIFEDEMNASATFKHLDDKKNPCHIMFAGIEFYVYVKNISSAYFSNPDVSRAQLTGVDTLNAIKQSDALFILLGYDSENRIFAAWNPHIAKQRIGTSSSPSLYSRFSWQKEAATQGDFITRELKNDGSVLLFPQEYISLFLDSIGMFFPDTSEYVAMGSKRRSCANAAYKVLINTQHLGKFAKFLSANACKQEDITLYVKSIKQLINSSLISSNRRLFLACDSLAEYTNAARLFFSMDELKKLDAENENVYSFAFFAYIDFLIDQYGEDSNEDKVSEEAYSSEIKESEEDEVTTDDTAIITHSEDVDYELPFIDEKGNLTLIANPKLIDRLREDLDSEYPRPLAAYATIEEFYGERFPNMEMRQWQALFKKINWQNPYPSLVSQPKDEQKQRATRQKIEVIFPDGRVVCENLVVNTLLEVINYAGIEDVAGLGITMGENGGSSLICTEVNEKYPISFKPLGDGLYVNTNSSTNTKLSHIQQINDMLKLGLVVALK